MPEHPERTKIHDESTRVRERRGGPLGIGQGSWVAIALIGFVILLLVLYLLLGRDDDGSSTPVSDRDVEVTQQDVDVDDEETSGAQSGEEEDTSPADDTAPSSSSASGGDTVVQEGDTVIIERSSGGQGGDGDVITQEAPASGTPATVDLTVAQPTQLTQFDDARLRVPTDTQLQLAVTNDSSEDYNAYLELAGVTVASLEPFVAAGETYRQTLTTPTAEGTYDVRVERAGGDELLTATLVLEDR